MDEDLEEGDEFLSRGVHHLGWITRTLKDLQGTRTVIRELIQNADDAPGATHLQFEVTDDALIVWNDGTFEKCESVGDRECPWLDEEGGRRCDFHSFRAISSGDKRSREGVTGAFGIGFTAVYQITDRPVLRSNGLRWLVDEMEPEDRRIRSRAIAHETGTTFELPWAREMSPFRRATRQGVITDEMVAEAGAELLGEIPRSLLFLNSLEVIEAVVDGTSYRFERVPVEDGVLIAEEGATRHWRVLKADFETAGRDLVDRYATLQPDRSTVVRVAVPSDGQVVGRLYATLPTEEPSHLPVHVDGSFYPVSDRKRIDFDDGPEAAWNATVLRAVADLLSDNLESLAILHGDRLITELLLAAHDARDRAGSGDIPTPFTAYWDAIAEALPSSPIVPRQIGGHGTPTEVRLWSDDREGAAAEALAAIGVQLVDTAARDRWWTLRSKKVPIQELRLDYLVERCKAEGLTARRQRTEMPGVLTEVELLDRLWSVADFLIAHRSSEQSKTDLRDCSIAPATDGGIWPLCEADRFDPQLLDALRALGADPTVLDLEALGPSRAALVGVTDEVQAWQVVKWAAEVPADDIDDSAAAFVLDWLHEQREELDAEDRALVVKAPIFPTAEQRRPLQGLALPGQFEDPLGLAGLVDLVVRR